MLKILVNCGPSELFIEKCVRSIQRQSHQDWQAFLTIDPCGDQTLQRAVAACGRDDRFMVHHNQQRQYAMVNLMAGISRSQAQPEDVVVILDGDDWFATETALEIIHATYQRHDCWLTYGSWIADDPNLTGMQKGLWPAYDNGTEDFRSSVWLGTAVRTWKRWLWDLIDDHDFRDAQGRYLQIVEDQAAMLPMLEMAGTEKAKHIADALMVYNRSTPHGVGKTRYVEMLENASFLRSLPPYPRLKQKPSSNAEVAELHRQIVSFRRRQQCCISS